MDPRDLARSDAARPWLGLGPVRCLDSLLDAGSRLGPRGANRSSGAYGIPQALPASKMAGAGQDWRTNPATQIRWGLDVHQRQLRLPVQRLGHSQSHGWY